MITRKAWHRPEEGVKGEGVQPCLKERAKEIAHAARAMYDIMVAGIEPKDESTSFGEGREEVAQMVSVECLGIATSLAG